MLFPLLLPPVFTHSRRPTRRPTKQPTKKPTNQPTKQPTLPPSPESCQLTAGDDPRIPCRSGQFCLLETGTCLTKAAIWFGVCTDIPEMCPANYDPVCGCDFKTYSNACTANEVPENVASKGACKTDSPTISPSIKPSPEPTNSCGLHCESDRDCAHGGFVECGKCDLTFVGTRTYKTCVDKISTVNPTMSPVETPTTDQPSPSPVEAPTTDQPSPMPVTPAPITPQPVERIVTVSLPN